jgi:hypothetical protein
VVEDRGYAIKPKIGAGRPAAKNEGGDMGRFLPTVVVVLVLVATTAHVGYASPQKDVVAQFERLGAMLEVGASRVDIQRQMVELKILIRGLQDTSPTAEFTIQADHLLEQIRAGFLIADLTLTPKSGVTVARETIDELLPKLKALSAGPRKKK